MPVNAADNWLHLVLAISMIGLGIALRRAPAVAQSETRHEILVVGTH